jgi:hypothetical protein
MGFDHHATPSRSSCTAPPSPASPRRIPAPSGAALRSRASQPAPGAPREALQGLGDVLRRRQEMLESLHYFRDMLIAG